MTGAPTLRERCRDALRQIEPTLVETDPSYMGAMVLLAALVVGADEAEIAKGLKFDPEYVRLLGSRLRGAGVWTGAETRESHRDAWEGPYGGTAFFMDVNVADGLLVITDRMGDGDARYKLTRSGEEQAKRLINKSGGRV